MYRKKIVGGLALFAALVLSACGTSEAEIATQTAMVQLVQTQAVMTYQAQLTQTAIANPTATPSATKSPTTAPTFSAPTAGSPVALGTAPTSGASASCYGLAFVSDVTIPDGTQMTPGQSFTKTWRVTNSGTCAWESGFTWNIVAGEAMGGVAVALNQRVEPGRQYEFSVPMVAPTDKSGKLRGTWRLSDANGNFFGDSPWVEISVGGSAAATSTTGAATSTTAPPTATTAPAP